MLKFAVGLALGLGVSAAMAQWSTKTMPAIIDCGPSSKAMMTLEMGVPTIRPYDTRQ